MDTNSDFREQLASAVAYRMIENFNPGNPHHSTPTAEEARNMVRHVMKNGTRSGAWEPVSKAATDLLSPLLKGFLPVLLPVVVQIVSSAVVIIQAENQRGQEAEETVEGIRRENARQRAERFH
jgi:hypothetical protein